MTGISTTFALSRHTGPQPQSTVPAQGAWGEAPPAPQPYQSTHLQHLPLLVVDVDELAAVGEVDLILVAQHPGLARYQPPHRAAETGQVIHPVAHLRHGAGRARCQPGGAGMWGQRWEGGWWRWGVTHAPAGTEGEGDGIPL